MKKLIIFVLVLILVIVLATVQKTNFAYLNLTSDASYVVISKDENAHLFGVDRVKNGETYIIKTNNKLAKYVFENANKIISEAWEIETNNADETVKEVLKQLKINVINYEELESVLVINGYSKLIKNYVLISDKKQNIQIAVKENYVIVATPLILQGF